MQQIELLKNAGPPSLRHQRPSSREGSSRLDGRSVFRLSLRGTGFTEPRSRNATCEGIYFRPPKSVKSAKIITRRNRRNGKADSILARRTLAEAASVAFR